MQRLLNNAREANAATVSCSSSSSCNSSSSGSSSTDKSCSDDDLEVAPGQVSSPDNTSSSANTTAAVNCHDSAMDIDPSPDPSSTPTASPYYRTKSCTAGCGRGPCTHQTDPKMSASASDKQHAGVPSSAARNSFAPPWYALTRAANATTGQDGAPQPWWKLDSWLTGPAEAQYQR